MTDDVRPGGSSRLWQGGRGWPRARRALAGTLALAGLILWQAALITYHPDPPAFDPGPLLARVGAYDVTIRRDTFGVPYVHGRRDADTAFGLAYAHAEDDFATIQTTLLATRGQLAGFIGPDGAPTDLIVRIMGFWDIVRRDYDSLPADVRALAEAYADGATLYATRHPAGVAPGLLPITGRDVVAGFMFRTPFMWGLDRTLRELFGPTRAHDLETAPTAAAGADQAAGIGSNGIAVAPGRSADGATRLLVNSHQPWTGPVAWYEARLTSDEGWDMAGGLFPGAPLILHGHNRDLGWANTVNHPDLADVYVLETSPDGQAYRLDGAWRPFERAPFAIDIKLAGPFHFIWRGTLKKAVQGPVIERPHGTYALRWAGMGEIRQLEAYYRLNRARDFDAWRQALAMQALPSINYVYADKTGRIAYVYNALLPKRPAGWRPGRYWPGDRSDLVWTGYWPMAALPQVVDPPSGFLVSANQTPFAVSSPGSNPDPEASPLPAIGEGKTMMTNRAARAVELLAAAPPIDDAVFEAVKYDDRYGADARVRTIVADILGRPQPADPDLRAARDHLATWDFATDRDNRGAALGILTAYPVVVAQLRGEALIDPMAALERAAKALKRRHGAIDPPWGAVSRLNRGGKSWPLDGGPDVLRAVEGADPDPGKPYEPKAGDSFIMFVTWDRTGRVSSRSIHNYGSATLDPASPHYADQAPLFAERRVKPVWLEEADLLAHLERAYRP